MMWIATQTGTENKQLPLIGLQLWSVKDSLSKDFMGTMEKIAEMGFSGVEFAGDYGPFSQHPEGLLCYLESLNLTVCGAHVRFEQFKADNFAESVEFFKSLGCQLLVIATDKRANQADKVDDFVADLVWLEQALRPHGLKLGYHNHAEEFANFNGQTYWDYLAKSTPNQLVLQQDSGWVLAAKKDPIQYIVTYHDRLPSTHLKAYSKTDKQIPLIGEDSTDWHALLGTIISLAQTDWMVLEQEEYPLNLSPLESVKRSKQNLDKIIDEVENLLLAPVNEGMPL